MPALLVGALPLIVLGGLAITRAEPAARPVAAAAPSSPTQVIAKPTEATSALAQVTRQANAANSLARAQANDSTLAVVLSRAPAYAVFPTVGKGAVGVGAAYGRGVLYENGVMTGYCDMTQASIGLALGG